MLRGVGLVREEFKGLSEVALFTEGLNQLVLAVRIFRCGDGRFYGYGGGWRFGRVARREVAQVGGEGGRLGGVGSGENPHHRFTSEFSCWCS